jgi:hypothetical protein
VASGSSGAYPTLQGMLVYYNGQVGYASTLQAALAKAFGTSPAPAPPGGSSPGTGSPAPANATVLKYLQLAESYYSDAQADLRNDNLTAYASDIAKMKAALDNATKAAQGSPASAASPTPSASASASPGP